MNLRSTIAAIGVGNFARSRASRRIEHDLTSDKQTTLRRSI